MRRATPALILIVTMLAVAWFVLRAPDVAQAYVFFTMGIPSLAAGEAVMTLLAWLVVVVAAGATFLGVFRGVRASRVRAHSTSYASLFLVVGLLLLAVGAVERELPAASMCCGSGPANMREAIQLAH
ncbi:MAG: hypothetical protein WAL84_12740 [Candidatus Dormiibacterota bacterium]